MQEGFSHCRGLGAPSSNWKAASPLSSRSLCNSTTFLTTHSCSLEPATDQAGFKHTPVCPSAPPRAASTGEPQDQSPGHAVDHILENRGRSLPLPGCDRSPFPTSALCCCSWLIPTQTLMKVSISILLRLASASISTWQMEHTYRWFTAGPPPNLRTGRAGGDWGTAGARKRFPAPQPAELVCYTAPAPVTELQLQPEHHKGHNTALGQCADPAHAV